jgi:hypothetical protein
VSIFDQCGSKHRANNQDGCSSQLLISTQTCDVGNLSGSHTYPPTHQRIYSMKNRSENYKILDAIVPRLVVPRCPKGHQHVSNLSMGQKFPGELGQRSWFVSYTYYLHMRFLVNITVPSVEALRMLVAKAKPSQWINRPGIKSGKRSRESTRRLGQLVFNAFILFSILTNPFFRS